MTDFEVTNLVTTLWGMSIILLVFCLYMAVLNINRPDK